MLTDLPEHTRKRFLSSSTTLVPVPGSAPLKDPHSRWSARQGEADLAQAIAELKEPRARRGTSAEPLVEVRRRLVASASVVGLAVAFGAQALIKDFFYGFFILIENQFTIGDVVTLGAVTGTVEKISLRITVLRDLKGVVHYIPNGSIGQVSNRTQGWSRVVMEVSVSYKEDPDRASHILGDVLRELAADEKWRAMIIEEPVVAGVENLTERAVDIRVMVKTRPGKQWEVAREARRRIKRRFDELGIEIPFPHRVVHHVYESEAPSEERSEPRSLSPLAGADGE